MSNPVRGDMIAFRAKNDITLLNIQILGGRCDILMVPSVISLHWELLDRTRATDTKIYIQFAIHSPHCHDMQHLLRETITSVIYGIEIDLPSLFLTI